MHVIQNKERNFAGIPYLYRKKGAVSTVVELNMKEEVDGVLLQKSVRMAIHYHPYLAETIIEERGERFLTPCRLPFEVKKTKTLRKLGSRETRYHLIDVTYWNDTIYIAFHHALCDGNGIKRLTELILSLYLSQKYQIEDFQVREELLDNEKDSRDPFDRTMYKWNKKIEMPEINKKAMVLPEVPRKMKEDKEIRYSFILDNDSLIKYAKKNEASPAIIIAILLSRSIHHLNWKEKRPVVCNMASDLREALGAEGTFKNVVNSIYLPYSSGAEKNGTKNLAIEYRKMIREQKEENYVKKCANAMILLFQIANRIPTIRAKQIALSFFENIKINTYTLSYPGRLDIGSLEEYVIAAHLYSCGNNGFFVNVMSVSKTTSIDIVQSFSSEKYIKEFIKQLDKAGITYEVEKDVAFVTPRDGLREKLYAA